MRLFAGRRARRPRRSCLGTLSVLVALLLGAAAPADAQLPWTWEGYFENVTSPGGPPASPTPADGASGMSRHPLSQDGRFVVFETTATNLGAPQGASAIFRRDRITGQLTTVQVGYVRNAAISADGWHVAFESCAQGFTSPCQIFARDLRSANAPVILVSSTASGVSGNGDSLTPTLSQTGRFVVYTTTAQNLSNDPMRRKQIVWRDRDADADGIYDEFGAVLVQSMSVAGATPGNGDSDTPEVSDDGRYVAFRSAAANLVGGDTNAMVDVFLRDRGLNTTRRLNLRPGNVQSPFPIAEPHISMSGNGQFVAFASADPFLTSSAPDGNAALDVFLYQGTSTLLRVDVGRSGSAPVPGNGPTGWATLNYDGRYVSLQSAATNAPFLSPTGSVQVYAVDRQYQTVTRISGMPDGTEPDAPSVQPSITAGGSLVVFSSSATTFTGVPSAVPQIHAAARLNVTPSDVHLMIQGGQSTVRIAAHTFTRLVPYTDPGGSWLELSLTLNAPDNNLLTVSAPENHGPTRTATVRIGTRTVTVTQDGNAMEAVAVWPTSGPMSGGTPVTIQGYGFTPDTVVSFGGIPVPTTFVDLGTLSAVTPAFPMRGAVSVTVAGAEQVSTLENAFMVFDDTPPVLSGIATGAQGPGGWFTGDVTVTWTAVDEQSAITASCGPATQTTDTAGTTFTCIATSEGGSTVASVVVKRDTTPPKMTFASPYQRQLVEPGAPLSAVFSCTDPLSGVADCGLDLPSGTTLDTSTPGWHTVSTTATDAAGNVGTTTIEYAVASGVCVAPVDGLKHWLRFEDDLDDVMDWFNGQNGQMPAGLAYGSGVAGRAFSFAARTSGGLEIWPYQTIDNPAGFSAAMWIQPDGMATGALLERMSQIEMSRSILGPISVRVTAPDGTVETFESAGVAPFGVWTHIGLTFDAGTVRLYLNGRLDSTWTASFQTLHEPGRWGDVRIGNYFAPRDMWPFFGKLDEFQLFNRALSAEELEAIFLSGGTGVCRPAPTTLTIPALTVTYGAGTFPAMAILRDGNGQPLAGKRIRLDQLTVLGTVDFPTTFAVTDADGIVRWDAPFSVGVGTYPAGLRAFFAGDLEYSHTPWVLGPLTVTKAPTQLTWAAPAPIRYGTALSGTQLNATASAAGTIAYSPAAGTVLSVGSRTLQATFTPSNANYATSTATVPIEVTTAVPTVSMTSATVTYTGLPQSLAASVRDYRGIALSPTTITYNGVAAAPVAAGVYDVVLTFAGNTNYEPVTASATLTINKATPAIAFSTPTTVTFDGQPHALVATVTGIGGTALGTAAVTYNGATDAPIDAGAYAVSATFDGNANYAARTVTTTLTIAKATPTVTLAPQPASFTYDGQPHGVTATVTGVAGAALGSAPVTYNGAAAEPVDAGSYTASATFAGSANYTARTQSTTLTIAKATPAIVFDPSPAAFVYDGQPHAVAATATGVGGAAIGTLPVTYDGSAAPPINAGTYTASATIAASANYTSRTQTATLTIASATPTLAISGGPFVFDGQPHPATVTVTGIGGQAPGGALTVTYNGSYAAPINAGTYAVVASVGAQGNYAAGTASGTLVVEPKTAAIVWSPAGPITYGATLSWQQLNAGSGDHVAGSWSYTPAEGTLLDAGTHTLSATFTPADTNYAPATETRSLEVRRAVPTLGLAFYNVFYDGQPHPAGVGVRGVNWELLEPVTVTYNGTSDVPVNAGVYVIEASYPGSPNYEPVSRTYTGEIYKVGSLNMSWDSPGTITYGTPLGPAQFRTTASRPGTFSYSPGQGAVLDAGSHTLTATFTPEDPVNYAGGTMTNTVTVLQAVPVITIEGDAATYDGQPHPAGVTVTGFGGEPLTPFTVTYNGSAALPVAVGTYDVAVTYLGSTNYRSNTVHRPLVIAKAAPALSWSAPAAIGYGTALGAAQLNATASVPGTFSYTPAAGTVLAAGSRPLSATFTPADPANYSGGSVATTIVVLAAPLTVRANDAGKVYGAALPGFTASFSGLVGGDTPASLGGALAFGTAATASSAVGTYAVTPTGLSSPNYAISFASGVLTIVKAPVAMTLTASPTPSGLDMPLTLTATVAAAQTAPTAPAGTVRFFDGATLLGTATLSGGTATLLTGGLTAGSHTIEARYDGDASFDPGSRTATHVVNTAAATPAITLTTSRQPAGSTQSMTFTATITVATSGTIAFYDGGTLLGSGAIASGRATLTVASLPAGSHAITARFQGTASAPPVISPVLVQSVTATGWKDRTSTLGLVSSATPSALGATVTFTATASGSSGTPTGRILFMVDGLVVGDPTGVAMSGAGQASVSVSTLNGGRHKVTATYLGNSNYRGSNGALTQTVN
jgi:Tol biopolymer transport system component